MSAGTPPFKPRFMLAAKQVGGTGVYIHPFSANSANPVSPATFTPATLTLPRLAVVRVFANSANPANLPTAARI